MTQSHHDALILIGSTSQAGKGTPLIRHIAKGMASAGAAVEKIFLQDIEIGPCTRCEICRKKRTLGVCVIQDGMQDIYPKLTKANAIVMLAPIFWFTAPKQLSLFMGRWYALGGEPGGNALKGKRVSIVLTYADVDPYASGAIGAIKALHESLRFMGAEIIGSVYGSTWKNVADDDGEQLEKARDLGKLIVGGK